MFKVNKKILILQLKGPDRKIEFIVGNININSL